MNYNTIGNRGHGKFCCPKQTNKLKHQSIKLQSSLKKQGAAVLWTARILSSAVALISFLIWVFSFEIFITITVHLLPTCSALEDAKIL